MIKTCNYFFGVPIVKPRVTNMLGTFKLTSGEWVLQIESNELSATSTNGFYCSCKLTAHEELRLQDAIMAQIDAYYDEDFYDYTG